MSTVNRQAAVDMLMERASALRGFVGDLGGACSGAAKLIMQMPPAEPKIIRCRDCKHRDKYGCCKYWKGLAMVDIPIATDDNDFCSRAERRENG